MLKQKLLNETGILMIEPDGKLQEDDFKSLNALVDPYVEQYGQLNGLMIYTESFPFWADFSALFSHIRFVKDHHKQVKKIALVSDSTALSSAPAIGKHFVAAEIKHFPFTDKNQAMAWLEQPGDETTGE